MTVLRFRPRHLQQTIFDHLKTNLTALDWMTPGGFKSSPISLIEYIPDEKAGVPIAPNTVGLTLGGEEDETLEELGGGLVSVPVAVFVDIYGENQAIALSIASDVKDILTGQMPGTSRTIGLYDYTANPRQLVTGELIEFEEVLRERPMQTEFRRNWLIVKATARLFYAGSASS